MATRPYDRWPGYVRNSFKSHINTPATWPVVMEDCIRNGIKDAGFITDVVFYLHVSRSHGWGPAAGDPDLEALWKYFNGIIRKRLRMKATDFDPKPVKVDHKKWRIIYLRDVDCDELGSNKDHRERLSSLRLLILRGLEGKNPRHNFDYYTYNWSKISGYYQPASDRMSNVQLVKRKKRKNALDSFNEIADSKVVEGSSMGNILRTVESDIFINTNVLSLWLSAGAGMGEGSAKGYDEVEWIKETIRLGKNPNHVYSIYGNFLNEGLKNSKKTRTGIWE